MSQDKEDQEQLERFRRGEPGAFDDLYATYGPRLYQFGLRLCGKPADAEDLKQDVFVAAFRNLHRFEGRSSLATYLYRIAVYRWGQMRGGPKPETVGWDETREAELDVVLPDPVHQSHTRMALRAALATLSDAQRMAFLLVKADGFTNVEAARMLNIPVGTVKFQVHEAMIRLRAQLGGEETPEEPPRRKKAARTRDGQPAVFPGAPSGSVPAADAAARPVKTKEFTNTIMDYTEIFANPEELEAVLGVPMLGCAPMISEQSLRLLRDVSPFSPLMESYRTLRTNLRFRKETPLRTLVIASSVPAEGKSTAAMNLAIAIAREKKRVILVDTDLRRPTQHKLFKRESVPGLTDVLAGTHSVEEVLCQTGIEHVSLITAGTSTDSPTELLGSEAMERLLDDLKERSDIVLLDTAPVLAVADTCTFAHATDGVLLVVGFGETKKLSVQRTMEILKRCRAEVLGTVLNRMPMEYRYYYGKYYVPTEERTAQESGKETQIGPAEDAPREHTRKSRRKILDG